LTVYEHFHRTIFRCQHAQAENLTDLGMKAVGSTFFAGFWTQYSFIVSLFCLMATLGRLEALQQSGKP